MISEVYKSYESFMFKSCRHSPSRAKDIETASTEDIGVPIAEDIASSSEEDIAPSGAEDIAPSFIAEDI